MTTLHVEPTSSCYSCARCGAPVDRYRDRGRTKLASYCKKCHAQHMRSVRIRGAWCQLEHLCRDVAPAALLPRDTQEDLPAACKCGHLPGYHSKYYLANAEKRRQGARERCLRHYWAQWLLTELRLVWHDARAAADEPISATGISGRRGKRTGHAISRTSCSTATSATGSTNLTPSGSSGSSAARARIHLTSG